MELPVSLKDKINKKVEGKKQTELLEISKEISKKYINESGKGNRLVTKEEEALVYSIVRMPATYGAIVTSLKWTLELANMKIESVLDAGAGTGAASWGIAETFNEDIKITCLERENAMINLGKEYMQNEVKSLSEAKWIECDVTNSEIPETADLVVSSYMLNELSDENRLQSVRKLWNATNKILLLVEPGTPESFKKMKKIREYLVEQNGKIIAPCMHNQNCEISENDWCQFTCRISRSKLHKFLKGGDSPFEDEKFFYLAIAKSESIINEASENTFRVLRHPKVENGRVTLKLCNENGICEKVITRKEKEYFKKARKIESGDMYIYNPK